MRILISAAIFQNERSMGSRRPRALAQLLAERGHDVTVVTKTVAEEVVSPPPPGVRQIVTVPYEDKVFETGPALPLQTRILVRLSVLTSDPAVFFFSHPKLAGLFGFSAGQCKAAMKDLQRRRYLTGNVVKLTSEDEKWVRQSLPIVKEALRGEPPFDAVLSTFGPLGSLWLGEKLFKKGFAKSWVSDLRDPIDQPGPLWLARVFRSFQQTRAVAKATRTTVVSTGARDVLVSSRKTRRFADKIMVITNGFLAQASEVGRARTSREVLTVGYTGSLYQGRRDPSMLLDAMRKINSEASEGSIRLSYAGRDAAALKAQAARFGVGGDLDLHGFVSHQEALRLQDEADVLLVLSWNTEEAQGVLPGKFAEYLATGKPIISLVNGEVPGAELTRRMEAVNAGIAVEDVSSERDAKRLERYLRDLLSAKVAGNPLPFEPDREAVALYNYEAITDQMLEILEEAHQSTTGTL